jgi:hypothetical protein
VPTLKRLRAGRGFEIVRSAILETYQTGGWERSWIPDALAARSMGRAAHRRSSGH